MHDNGQSGNAQTESLIHLRPMDLGDILDGTIRVYRKRPWLFVSIIAVLAGIPMAIIQISGLQISEYIDASGAMNPANPIDLNFLIDNLVPMSLILICLVFNFFLHTIATGATVHAVSETILGREVQFTESIKAVWPFTGDIILARIIAGVIIASSMIPGSIIIGIASTPAALMGSYGAGIAIMLIGILFLYVLIGFLAVKFLFIPQAVVLEKLDAFKSISRTWNLTSGFGWRTFGFVLILFIILGIIGYALGIGIELLTGLVGKSPGVNHGMVLAFQGVLLTLVSFFTYPIQLIAYTLIYYDLRIRREGFDLMHLARSIDGGYFEPSEQFDDGSFQPIDDPEVRKFDNF